MSQAEGSTVPDATISDPRAYLPDPAPAQALPDCSDSAVERAESNVKPSDPDLAVLVSRVECAICKGGYDHPRAADLALDDGWMRDGTAWICPRCFVTRR